MWSNVRSACTDFPFKILTFAYLLTGSICILFDCFSCLNGILLKLICTLHKDSYYIETICASVENDKDCRLQKIPNINYARDRKYNESFINN